ncbi:Hypothetical protein GSB_10139 [Giardia duodenalis]|nr:Hypothetical protein GL50581_2799 [Giardia intestinalis ATCC 50581]ESU44723.1 Hypothetical protein GSB_10139 [Giardia intestinalis]
MSAATLVNTLQYNVPLQFSNNGKVVTGIVRRYSGEDLQKNADLHAAFVSLYTHILPDVDRDECKRDLIEPNTVHIGVFRSDQEVRGDWQTRPIRILKHYKKYHADPISEDIELLPGTDSAVEDTTDIYKSRSADSSFSGPTDDEEPTGERLMGRIMEYIKAPKQRKEVGKFIKAKLPRLHTQIKAGELRESDLDATKRKIRHKDRILGGASILIRDNPEGITEPCRLCQLIYIGVRTRFQLLKLGRRICATTIYKEAVEEFNSDVYFTYAGSNAIRFFKRCGLDDDPMIAGRYAHLDNEWTDVLPMARLLKVPAHMEQILASRDSKGTNRAALYSMWRDAAFRRYAEESHFVSHCVAEMDRMQQRLASLEKAEKLYNTVLAQERSRCIMYEQIIAKLESQLLDAGIKPSIDRDEILKKVVEKIGAANNLNEHGDENSKM